MCFSWLWSVPIDLNISSLWQVRHSICFLTENHLTSYLERVLHHLLRWRSKLCSLKPRLFHSPFIIHRLVIRWRSKSDCKKIYSINLSHRLSVTLIRLRLTVLHLEGNSSWAFTTRPPETATLWSSTIKHRPWGQGWYWVIPNRIGVVSSEHLFKFIIRNW